MSEKLETTIRSVKFGKDDFAIMDSDDGLVKGSLCGLELKTLIDTEVTLTGEWESHPKFGSQFAFKSISIREDMVLYFLTKVIGGVPLSSARLISEKYGEKTWDILDKEPEVLQEFKGIGDKVVARIKKNWEKNKGHFNLARFMMPHGVESYLVMRVHEHFGQDAIEMIKDDPYILTEVRGIGFRAADDFALSMGVSKSDPSRMQACANYSLLEGMYNGNSSVTVKQLMAGMYTALEGSSESITNIQCLQGIRDLHTAGDLSFVALEQLEFDEHLKKGDLVSQTRLFKQERFILNTVTKYRESRGQIVPNIDEWIKEYEEKVLRKELGPEQKDAIRLANTLPGIFSISGYAGTGKTTCSKAVLGLIGLQFERDEVACCALAGVAANRVKMQSGYDGQTIHSLLGFDGSGYTYNKDNKLPYKVVLLDEASMVDVEIMAALFRAIDFDTTTLVLLGDPAQLPPVGIGQPYSDILKNELIQNVTLTKIYRTDADSVITSFAADVRIGKEPAIDGKFNDFRYYDMSIPNFQDIRASKTKEELAAIRDLSNLEIRNFICDIAATHRGPLLNDIKRGRLWEFITRFQVVAPMKRGVLGVNEINKALQATLNPDPVHFMKASGDNYFSIGDKVVHLRNKDMEVVRADPYHPELDFDNAETVRVFNGQLGVIMHASEDIVHVFYPIEKLAVAYKPADIKSNILDLAYALTVHKTQGSEYGHVVMPMTTSYYVMLKPKLMYTAMTRAKHRLDVVGHRNAFSIGCRQSSEDDRVTSMDTLAKSIAKAKQPASIAPQRNDTAPAKGGLFARYNKEPVDAVIIEQSAPEPRPGGLFAKHAKLPVKPSPSP